MEQSKLAEAEAARNQKRQEWLAKVKESTGNETWEKLNSVKNSAGKTIMDVFKESPQLLDTPESTAVTIDLFKSYSNSHSTTAGDLEGVIEKGASPAKPSGGSGDGDNKLPEYGSQEFMEKFGRGEISDEEINKMETSPEVKIFLIQNKPRTVVNSMRDFLK
jgi:hypothetical protein